ncbi:factor of DNA methylation 2-like [Cornus florida]|uniref:factor of DNA methylation 2-like n=1 Tax=Cornus florida TaxID=4283 RepID=UPI00289DE320|nr:factor of DNA methylation 2-like [Cornus florida]
MSQNPLPTNGEGHNPLWLACINQISATAELLRQLEEQKVQNEDNSKQKDNDDLRDLNQTLIVKERQSNEELQEARKILITGLSHVLSDKTDIVIKRMGEIDEKPFLNKFKKSYRVDVAMVKAAEMQSSWQEKLSNPEWHPFKVVIVQGNPHEVLNEDDEQLKYLKRSSGGEIYKAVTKALKEMNEYNPSGRYVVSELWLLKENRRASLKDVINFMLQNMNNPKPKPKRKRGLEESSGKSGSKDKYI